MNSFAKWIHKFEIKKNVWVFVPSDEAILLGQEIKSKIERKWKPPHNYFHLKKGGHIAALKQHTDNLYFLRLDIENFFGSINKSRVTRALKPYFGYNLARDIAIQSTVIMPNTASKKFILPFGFVQSPILASICLEKSILGSCLKKIASNKLITVTVYMDDMIFSSKEKLLLDDVLDNILNASDRSGFKINSDKTEGPSRNITAFNIDISQGNTRISQDRMNSFLSVYRNSSNPYQQAGIFRYVEMINPYQASIL